MSQGTKELMRRSFLLRNVPEEGLEFCLSEAYIQQALRGEVLYSPERFQRCLGLVLSGRVRVSRKELFVAVLEKGDWFGAAALFTERDEFPSTLTALTECTVLFIPQQTIKQLMSRWPQAGENYVRYLSGRIGFLSDRLNSLAAGSAEEKVEQFLLRSADETGVFTGSATAIAQALGLGRASIYRAFETLEGRGVITRDGKHICLVKTRE